MIKRKNNIGTRIIMRVGNACRVVIRNRIEESRLVSKDVSIISNNCMGGIIYHDLNMKFLSPTINLKILPDDFIKFVEDLNIYLSLDFEQVYEQGVDYPIGKLGDIKVYFVHYKSFQEAVDKWNERKARILFNNIRIMMTVRDGYSNDVIERFNQLPYHKVLFDDSPHPECQDSICVRKNGTPLSGFISDIYNCFGKRGYQYGGFKYISFLNKG